MKSIKSYTIIYSASDSIKVSMSASTPIIPTGQIDALLRKPPMEVPDDYGIPLHHFSIPVHYEDSLDNLILTHGTIVDRVEKIAHDIMKDYHEITIHICVVLKGASTYFQDLHNAMRRIHEYNRKPYIPFTIDFVRVKSYAGTESTGNVSIVGIDVEKLRGKHVLFVEDIIDTGLTMTKLLEYLNKNVQPASVRVTALIEKRTDRSCGFKADYVGFSVPDKFICGYCLDYNEAFRDLNHIGVINQVGIDKFRDYDTNK